MVDGFHPPEALGLCLGVAETCHVIDLDISVSKTRGNHSDIVKPDLLHKFSSKHAKILEFPDIRQTDGK